MNSYREILQPEWFEKCARHTTSHTARTQQFGYYCDDCTRRLTQGAFNGRPPMHHGETLDGACGLCNKLGLVTLRTWFVCPICWGVVVAFQKSLVSTNAILHYWKTIIFSEMPWLQLRETDEIRIEPFVRKRTTKKQAAATLDHLDFVGFRDDGHEPGHLLFHLEQKTGPGSVDSMKEFQLDVNDYEDVVGACLNTGLAAYLVHVQVGQEYLNNTRRVVTAGMWWTDVIRLRKALLSVKNRRGEDKQAAYFRPSAFQSMESLVHELRNEGYLRVSQQLLSTDLSLR